MTTSPTSPPATGWLELTGRVVSLDGYGAVEGVVSEPAASEQEAESLGDGLADDPMAQGARDILEEVSALLAAKRARTYC